MSNNKIKLGELRPTQLLHTFGVGSIIDLPYMSVMVMGIDDWNTTYSEKINEDRLLKAVKDYLGNQVKELCLPPIPEKKLSSSPLDENNFIGVPVIPFPRWMVCPACRILAPLNSGLFEMKKNAYSPDKNGYAHINCNKSKKPPLVIPARFMVACSNGHLDDFPWNWFVHYGRTDCKANLSIIEFGVSGEVESINIKCDTCGEERRISQAFGDQGKRNMPRCRGFNPHLKTFDEKPCSEQMKSIIIGASNSWFSLTISVISIPSKTNKLAQLVESNWSTLEKAVSLQIINAFRGINVLNALAEYSDEEILEEVLKKLARDSGELETEKDEDLKSPEYKAFINPDPTLYSKDFKLEKAVVSQEYSKYISKVVLVERLREVQALIGFTRIDSLNNSTEIDELQKIAKAGISRKPPAWVPASEIRGEGIFIEFNHDLIETWSKTPEILDREKLFLKAHIRWGKARGFLNPEENFPGIKYILLHSFSHALMRQLILECGYSAASIKEKIYASTSSEKSENMSGVLIYTAAADSEGTLGGLVALGTEKRLGKLIDQALEDTLLCSSDPLCSEHKPEKDSQASLHGATCHACLFSPETSCEKGNKYLDRAVLVSTMVDNFGFFEKFKNNG